MKKYWFLFATQIVNALAYPGELVGRSLIIAPFMWIFYQLWSVTFHAAGTTEINGLTLRMVMWYLMLAETVELSATRVSATISEAVKDGSIAYILNKPYNFLLYHYSTAMGETLFRAVINALLGGAMIWWLVGPPPDPRGWPFVALAMVGAWTLHLCFSALIGLAAFIVEDVSAFQWVYQKMAFILGGLLIPLDLYPGWLQAIAKALPFASMTYGPARLFVEPAPSAILSTLGLQAVWIVIVGSVLALAYQRGMAYLAVNGG